MQKTNNAALRGGFFMWGRSMFKRFSVAAALLGMATACHAAGTIAYSLSQQLDQYGNPLTGCKLYTIQAGTTSTPQNSYKDTALTLPQPNPLVCDAAGRLPQFFLADGLIKIRLDDKNGLTQVTADNILVIGPSSGGGGGGSIDPTTIATTGDVKVSYNTQPITGWVRMNARTVGSATSGATERANADVQALFQYLWAADTSLVVVGGRGASSIADWTANKQITLPDVRGRVLAGLDDMGGADSARLGGSSLAGGRFTLGFAAGEGTHLLNLAEIPSHSHAVTDPGHAHQFNVFNTGTGAAGSAASGSLGLVVTSTATTGITIQNNGGGQSHNLMQPTMLVTYYIKL